MKNSRKVYSQFYSSLFSKKNVYLIFRHYKILPKGIVHPTRVIIRPFIILIKWTLLRQKCLCSLPFGMPSCFRTFAKQSKISVQIGIFFLQRIPCAIPLMPLLQICKNYSAASSFQSIVDQAVIMSRTVCSKWNL